MSTQVILAWIGNTDLRAAEGEISGLGPIAQACVDRKFDEIHLLSDHKKAVTAAYVKWLSTHVTAPVKTHAVKLSGPTEFAEIYEAAIATIGKVANDRNVERTFHLSPGTPAMAAVWILLAKTSHPATLIESSPQQGVRTVALPFDIAADYMPTASPASEDDIVRLTQGLPPIVAEFDAIIHKCDAMKRVIAQARRVASFDVPVLIQGESGTGKELFALAIHKSSDRADGSYIPVNCGAIPENLVEAELFGHKAGAFTDAKTGRAGYVEEADGGTLFLDEIGELPLSIQVKLLRVLQQGTVQRIGESRARKVNFRVVAATNRVLVEEVADGRFREDLFHRLAVGVITLPALRDRPGDINALIDYYVERMNSDQEGHEKWVHKKISAEARNLLKQHPWKGNIRELFNTLSRAAIFTPRATLTADDIRQALFPIPARAGESDFILNRSIGSGFDVREVISEVARHYLKRALDQEKGVKSKACDLVGLGNATTFTNWMNTHGVEA